MKENISRRGILKGLFGLAATSTLTAGSGLVTQAEAGERVTGGSFLEKVRSVRSAFESEKGFSDKAFEVVTYKEKTTTRNEIIESLLRSYQPENIDHGTWQILSGYLIGIPAIESRFDTSRISNASAVGYWQFTQIAITELNNKLTKEEKQDQESTWDLQDTTSIYLGTLAALEYFDRVIYPSCVESVHTTRETLDLSQTETDTLLAFIMINAFNAGITRMNRLLGDFNEIMQKNKESIKKVLSTTETKPEEVFDLFSDVSLKNGYGKEASSYTFRAIAAAEYLHELHQLYSPSVQTSRR
jgi:hypothetical protein